MEDQRSGTYSRSRRSKENMDFVNANVVEEMPIRKWEVSETTRWRIVRQLLKKN